MNTENEEKTITLTEEQLGHVIKTAIKEAMNELKQEEELPGNEVDEAEHAPASFSFLQNIATVILVTVIIFFIIVILACIQVIFDTEYRIMPIIMIIDSVGIVWGAISLIKEIAKTKRLEVLNTTFSAIMALSTLLVAVVSAYFAYQSFIGGGAA